MAKEREDLSPRAIPKDEVSRRKGWLKSVDTFDAIVYGGGAAAIVGYSLWWVLSPVWRTGSATERSVLVGLLALAVVVVANDVWARRWSLLSRLLAAAWGFVLGVLILLSILG